MGAACPTCGASVTPAQLERFGGACSRCVLLFAAEESPPTFPNLELQDVLGRGGMGVVYRAVQPHLQRTVALKVLSPKLLDEPGALDRFTREAAAMAKLQHPHVVTLHDFGVHGGVPFLIMEHVQGASLRKLLRDGPLLPARALEIAGMLCAALGFAHRRGIVHRDLKPENVLLDPEGRVKLADFGLARFGDRATTRLTASGLSMGTPGYMAPEQIERAQESDARSDLYSLGILLYEMLTGRLPLGRFSLPSATPGVDRRIDAVVLRLLERDPALRYPSAEAVAEDLRRVGTSSRTRAPWAVAVAAAILALGGILALLRRPAEARPPLEAPPVPAPAWAGLGRSAEPEGLNPGPRTGWYPALAVDRSGGPVAAWQEGLAPRSLIRMARWKGAAWSDLASPSGELADAGHPSVALDSRDLPVVAWHDNRTGNYEIYLRRWNGAAWEDLSGSGSGPGISRTPDPSTRPWLALDAEDRPVVAWVERLGNTFRVPVSRWNGSDWSLLGDVGVLTSLQMASPVVQVDPGGRPHVLWRSSDETSTRFRVHRFEAGAWNELGELCLPQDVVPHGWESAHAAMASDAEGRPLVAYGHGTAPSPRIRVRRWDGSGWRNVGEPLNGEVHDAGTPVLPSLAVGPAGEPVVAWSHGVGDRRALRVRRWTGAAWSPEGAFDLAGAFLRLTFMSPHRPALVVDGDGRPSVAFVDMADGLWKVRLLRLDR